MRTVVLWILVAWFAIGGLCGVYFVGHPRKPMTAGGAVFALLVCAATIAGIFYVHA